MNDVQILFRCGPYTEDNVDLYRCTIHSRTEWRKFREFPNCSPCCRAPLQGQACPRAPRRISAQLTRRTGAEQGSSVTPAPPGTGNFQISHAVVGSCTQIPWMTTSHELQPDLSPRFQSQLASNTEYTLRHGLEKEQRNGTKHTHTTQRHRTNTHTMNRPSRTEDDLEHPTWNQNPPFLAPDLTTRQDLNGIANTREHRHGCAGPPGNGFGFVNDEKQAGDGRNCDRDTDSFARSPPAMSGRLGRKYRIPTVQCCNSSFSGVSLLTQSP